MAPCGMEMNDRTAVIFGVGVTVLLSSTMVVAGLKAGITPGASTLVVLTAWSAFRNEVKRAGGGRFLNLTQVAGSSGMAVVSGVIFTAPLLQVLHLMKAQDVLNELQRFENNTLPLDINLKTLDWPSQGQPLVDEHYVDENGNPLFPGITIWTTLFMMMFTTAGSFIGYGFVGISTKKFLSDPSLPAPEAHACATMVRASAASEADQPSMLPSLVTSTLTSFILPVFATLGAFPNYLILFSRIFTSHPDGVKTERKFNIEMPCSPVYIGIGGLLTLSTALVTVAGAFTRLGGDFAVAPLSGDAAEMFPAATMRWIGGGAMTVGVVFSLIKFMIPRAAVDGDNGDESLLDIPQQVMLTLYGSIGGGILLLATGIVVIDSSDLTYALVMIVTITIMASLMVTLGAILSLQIGSSASPVSGTVFVTTLVCCLATLFYRNAINADKSQVLDAVEGISYMLVTACVAVSSANDASQDYKTLQLGGIAPRDGFFGQIAGLMAGSVVVPISFAIAHNAYGLGTSALPAPQGELFAIIIDGILIQESIPWIPVIIGLVIGAIAVAIEVFASTKGMQLPAMAFAVGLYLPPALGLGILFGAGCRFFGEKAYASRTGKAERTYESILAAAGMITGAAFLDLIVGCLVIIGVSAESMAILEPDADAEGVLPQGFRIFKSTFGVIGLCLLGGILYYNARFGIPEATATPELNQQLSTMASFDASNRKLSQPLTVEGGTELQS